MAQPTSGRRIGPMIGLGAVAVFAAICVYAYSILMQQVAERPAAEVTQEAPAAE